MSRYTGAAMVVNQPPRLSTRRRRCAEPGQASWTGVIGLAERPSILSATGTGESGVGLEALCQPVTLAHRSHPLVAVRHRSDELLPGAVRGPKPDAIRGTSALSKNSSKGSLRRRQDGLDRGAHRDIPSSRRCLLIRD